MATVSVKGLKKHLTIDSRHTAVTSLVCWDVFWRWMSWLAGGARSLSYRPALYKCKCQETRASAPSGWRGPRGTWSRRQPSSFKQSNCQRNLHGEQ